MKKVLNDLSYIMQVTNFALKYVIYTQSSSSINFFTISTGFTFSSAHAVVIVEIFSSR